MAKAAGLATGNVSTAELQDATPAALVAHVTSRKCYGRARPVKMSDNALEKGGKDRLPNSCLTPVPMLRLAAAQNLAETATAGEWQGKRCVNRHRRVVISW